MLAASEPLRWQPHPEVWLLVVAVVGLGFYVTRVIQPKVVAAGETPITRRQKGFFAAGVAVLWLASDWPVHDIADSYLYSVHMIQHLVLTLIMPPLLLFAMPAWLVRLVLGSGRLGAWLSKAGRPLVAGLTFNALVAFTHWAWIVNTSARVGAFHYLVHLVIVVSALLMWMPVCGPVPELRMNLPLQMVYLFLMSVIPTVPAAFLTVADNVLYESYAGSYRLFGISPVDDQQAAGLIMKLGGGSYLWAIITVLFFKWAGRHMKAERARVPVTERQVLTFEEVQAAFEATRAAQSDPVRPEAAN